MMNLYRRHRPGCPKVHLGRACATCDCPIWIAGYEEGISVRKSLKTRDWGRALKIAATYDVTLGGTEIDELAVARGITAIADHERKGAGWVYLAGTASALKIGTTRDVRNRLDYLRTAHHTALRLRRVFAGDVQLERKLHEVFAQYRKHGEWFSYNATMQAFVERSAALASPEDLYNSESHKSSTGQTTQETVC